MEYRELIRHIRSSRIKQQVVSKAVKSQHAFNLLLKLFLNGSDKERQYAIWALSDAVIKCPERIDGKLGAILAHLQRPELHDAEVRGVVRMLQFISLPEEFHGEIARYCFSLLRDVRQPVAIRCFSMTVLARLCSTYPELSNELILVIKESLPHASSGYRNRAGKVLNKIIPDWR